MFTVTATVLTTFQNALGNATLTGRIRCIDPHGSMSTYDRPFEIEVPYDAHANLDALAATLRPAAYEQAHYAADFAVGYHGHSIKINEPDAALVVVEFDFDSPRV